MRISACNIIDNRKRASSSVPDSRKTLPVGFPEYSPATALGARGIRPGYTFVAVAGSQLIEHLREMRLARGLALGVLDPADVVVALIRRPTSRSTIFSGKNVSKRGPTEAVFGTFLPKYASERSGEPCAVPVASRPGCAPPRQRRIATPADAAPSQQRPAPAARRPTTPSPATRRATQR